MIASMASPYLSIPHHQLAHSGHQLGGVAHHVEQHYPQGHASQAQLSSTQCLMPCPAHGDQTLCQLPVDGPVQAEQDGEGDDRHEDQVQPQNIHLV